jgi:hypothetical protein
MRRPKHAPGRLTVAVCRLRAGGTHEQVVLRPAVAALVRPAPVLGQLLRGLAGAGEVRGHVRVFVQGDGAAVHAGCGDAGARRPRAGDGDYGVVRQQAVQVGDFFPLVPRGGWSSVIAGVLSSEGIRTAGGRRGRAERDDENADVQGAVRWRANGGEGAAPVGRDGQFAQERDLQQRGLSGREVRVAGGQCPCDRGPGRLRPARAVARPARPLAKFLPFRGYRSVYRCLDSP